MKNPRIAAILRRHARELEQAAAELDGEEEPKKRKTTVTISELDMARARRALRKAGV